MPAERPSAGTGSAPSRRAAEASDSGGPSEPGTGTIKDRHRLPTHAPEPWFSFLGFVFVTKADLLAAAAFLLSVTTLIYQLSSSLAAPAPSVYAPDVVYVFFDPYANNSTVLRFAAQISLVNTAGERHDAIVRDIGLTVTAPDLDVSEDWLSFVTIQRSGSELLRPTKEAAHPFPVVAGGAASYTVSFAPTEQACGELGESRATEPPKPCDPDRNFLDDARFSSGIERARALRLVFSVRIVGQRKPLTTSCILPIGMAFRQYIAENSWFAARCYSKGNET